MNNDQFRRLISSNPSALENGALTTSKPRTLLGARPKSSAPNAGRSYGASLFAKKTEAEGGDQKKKVRTNVPKGSRLAAGYVDRTKEKREDEEDDEVAQKLKALEEQMKEGEIDVETFERLRDELTAGDISKTHLVKGLDRKLLERIRRGENVLAADKAKETNGKSPEPEENDDEFNELEQHEVTAAVKEDKIKQGEKAKFVPTVAGQKRSRDQILADMKAAREAAKAAARPQLGTGFKKIKKDTGPRVEVDEKGREVLITIDENGREKRRVRKARVVEIQPEEQPEVEIEVEVKKSSKNKDQPLGADVNIPTYAPLPEEESDDDIFAGAGHEFNPLAGLEDDEVSDTEAKATSVPELIVNKGETEENDIAMVSGSEEGEAKSPAVRSPPAPIPTDTLRKGYFDDDPSLSVLSNIKNDFSADRLASLAKSQRAQEISATSEARDNETPEDAAKRKRREVMLASGSRDRDMEDMDMGFGGSRFDDAEEMAQEGEKTKFSKWKGLKRGEDDGEEDEEEGGGKGKKERKRGGGKKRKGDKNSVADIMGAIERQKKG